MRSVRRRAAAPLKKWMTMTREGRTTDEPFAAFASVRRPPQAHNKAMFVIFTAKRRIALDGCMVSYYQVTSHQQEVIKTGA
jgi:hypothetical protein